MGVDGIDASNPEFADSSTRYECQRLPIRRQRDVVRLELSALRWIHLQLDGLAFDGALAKIEKKNNG